MTSESGLNEDFVDLLRSLIEAHVEFVVVGAHAMAAHGVPRATGDLDVLVRPCSENAARVVDALRGFGAPLSKHGVEAGDFEHPGAVYQLGLPPRRIDLMTSISGIAFEQAWESRVFHRAAGLEIPFLGRQALIENKRSAARDKDLLDVLLLEENGS